LLPCAKTMSESRNRKALSPCHGSRLFAAIDAGDNLQRAARGVQPQCL
jgi:hypothetical protein